MSHLYLRSTGVGLDRGKGRFYEASESFTYWCHQRKESLCLSSLQRIMLALSIQSTAFAGSAMVRTAGHLACTCSRAFTSVIGVSCSVALETRENQSCAARDPAVPLHAQLIYD